MSAEQQNSEQPEDHQPLHIEIDDDNKMTDLTTDEELLSSPGGLLISGELIDGDVKMEETVGSAVASEKAKLRQLSTFLEKWVSQNGSNLYPSRVEKEQLAQKANMTYIQVNRWFANRRRKVTKRTKAAPSPASVTPVSTTETGAESFNMSAELLSAFVHAFSATKPSVEKPDMVMQNSDTPLTPPAEDQSTFPSQVVPDMSTLAAEAAVVQKLLSGVQLPPLPGYNANLLSLLPHLAAGYSPLQIYQLQMVQQQLLQHQLQAQLLAAQQQEQQRQMQSNGNPQHPMWMSGGSISASPAHISDSEISELSELSPPPSTQRPHSPFKDPHRLADRDMMALMSLSKLSEREQLAVNILVEMATDVR